LALHPVRLGLLVAPLQVGHHALIAHAILAAAVPMVIVPAMARRGLELYTTVVATVEDQVTLVRLQLLPGSLHGEAVLLRQRLQEREVVALAAGAAEPRCECALRK